MTVFSSLPLPVSASTLYAVRCSAAKSTFTRTVAPGVVARFSPATWLAKTAGIVNPVASPIMLIMPAALL